MRLALLALALLLIAAAPAPAPSSADAAFTRIWQAEWAWRATERIADLAPDETAAHLPDVSATAQARRTAYWRGVMKQLDAIDQAALSPDKRIDFQVYRQQIAATLEDQDFGEWQKPVNGDSAFWSDMQYAARGDFVHGEGDYRNYLSWLAELPR